MKPGFHSGQLLQKTSALLIFALLVMWSAPSTAWAQTVTPAPQDSTGTDEEAPYAGSFEVLEGAINNFWSETFLSARTAYQPPNVVDIDHVLDTGCGRHGPERVAFYCHTDQSIYLNPQFLPDQEVLVGDYAPVMVLAHEWGDTTSRTYWTWTILVATPMSFRPTVWPGHSRETLRIKGRLGTRRLS